MQIALLLPETAQGFWLLDAVTLATGHRSKAFQDRAPLIRRTRQLLILRHGGCGDTLPPLDVLGLRFCLFLLLLLDSVCLILTPETTAVPTVPFFLCSEFGFREEELLHATLPLFFSHLLLLGSRSRGGSVWRPSGRFSRNRRRWRDLRATLWSVRDRCIDEHTALLHSPQPAAEFWMLRL